MLLREEKGQLKKYVVDLSDASVFNSPAYYLKQNDVIYVEPGVGAKIQGSNAMTFTQIIGSSLSLFISVFTLISVTK
jgi:polysaccharide export outer membrane protein